MLAPVGISVYTRLAHFKRAIEALQRNTLAPRTNLIIYSDAPSKDEDIPLVDGVRLYAKSIDGFRTVTVIERPNNYGGVKNAHKAVLQLVRIFKQAIFIEDDIETAPGFLAFMNDALDFYRNDLSVTSISGYSPPLNNINNYVTKDFYVMNRFCGWGCGLYERTATWLSQKISPQEFDALENKEVLCEFGQDVLSMVKKEVDGELDAADVRCMFRQAVHNCATIYPKHSLVQNFGHDGSGYHCGATKRFQHEELWDKTSGFEFDKDLSIDSRIKKEQQDFRAFRGEYVVHRVIHNQNQAKEVASVFIDNLFAKDLKSLPLGKKPVSKKMKVAILSTPRVGSTYLSHLLYPYFGQSIKREWLHLKYFDAFKKTNPNASPESYLDTLNHTAFDDCDYLGLHFHVNQVLAWQKKFGVGVFDYFGFDHIIYVERKNIFAQAYSLAVATESGLWGSEIINSLNLAENFQVQITEDAFDRAYKGVIQERNYYETHLKGLTSHTIAYEDLVVDSQALVKDVFEGQLQMSPMHEVEGDEDIPNKCVSIVNAENRKEMEAYFNTTYVPALFQDQNEIVDIERIKAK